MEGGGGAYDQWIKGKQQQAYVYDTLDEFYIRIEKESGELYKA